MALTAYLPLESVYAFHEPAEQWIRRRFAAQVTQAAGAERTRGPWGEIRIQVFPDRSSKDTQQQDRGQTGPKQATIYTRTPIRVTDTAQPQPADLLFDPQGNAWQAISSGDWLEARGYAITVQWVGRRGQAHLL
jgi:hypothetical protein